MARKFSHNIRPFLDVDGTEVMSPSVYNIRPCPQCGSTIFGMPGGRDAHCSECGYKDPCCSD